MPVGGGFNCGGWENSEGGCAKKVIIDLCASERESDVNDGRISAIVSTFYCFFFLVTWSVYAFFV